MARGRRGRGVRRGERGRDVAELQRIAVAPDHRRTGIAGRLLADVVRLARAEDVQRLLLEVRPDNEGALAFYGAQGFVELDRRPRYYRDGADAIVLELPLTGPDVNVWTTS